MTRALPGVGPVGGELPAARTRPLPDGAVRLAPSGALGRWQERNAAATLPHCLAALEASGSLDNLRRLLDADDPEHHDGPYRGDSFTDLDVHTTLEAIAWESARADAPQHEEEVGRIVGLLQRVQAPSGYLDSSVLGAAAPSCEPYADVRRGHELAVLGHLVQAGVARARATGEDDLLDLAMVWAGDVVARLSDGEELVGGHPGAESALVELYRETGDPAYREAARRMLDLRGYGRQPGLLAGVVDLYLETGEAGLLAAAVRQWDDAHGRRTRATGGTGPRHEDESVGDPYELPPEGACAESCAAVAGVLQDWRMLLATGEARYAASLEHGLVDVVAVAAGGTTFSDAGPPQVRAGRDGAHEHRASGRRAWSACACCPPDLARLVASLHTMVATRGAGDGAEDALVVHLYADADLEVAGSGARLTMRTGYPWDGDVLLTADEPAPVPLALRLPGRADPARTRLVVDGGDVDVSGALDAGGYLRVGAGARRVRLTLPLEPRTMRSDHHPRYRELSGEQGADGVPGAPVELPVRAVPYAVWGNRGEGPMRVWTPVAAPPRRGGLPRSGR